MEARFELEQQIMDCWHITDDLDMLFEAILDQELPKDKIANIVLGLKDLYQLKFERTFDTFERMISEEHNSVPERVREAVLSRESFNIGRGI